LQGSHSNYVNGYCENLATHKALKTMKKISQKIKIGLLKATKIISFSIGTIGAVVLLLAFIFCFYQISTHIENFHLKMTDNLRLFCLFSFLLPCFPFLLGIIGFEVSDKHLRKLKVQN
jgi:hypothetical protein